MDRFVIVSVLILIHLFVLRAEEESTYTLSEKNKNGHINPLSDRTGINRFDSCSTELMHDCAEQIHHLQVFVGSVE